MNNLLLIVFGALTVIGVTLSVASVDAVETDYEEIEPFVHWRWLLGGLALIVVGVAGFVSLQPVGGR